MLCSPVKSHNHSTKNPQLNFFATFFTLLFERFMKDPLARMWFNVAHFFSFFALIINSLALVMHSLLDRFLFFVCNFELARAIDHLNIFSAFVDGKTSRWSER